MHYPYKFHGRDMSGILFFIFASCEPLTVATEFHGICVSIDCDCRYALFEYESKLKY